MLDDDEDFFGEGGDDEDFLDTTAEEAEPEPKTEAPTSPASPTSSAGRQERRGVSTPKRLVVRQMSDKMAQKLPGVASVLLTRTDGRQVMLLRR